MLRGQLGQLPGCRRACPSSNQQLAPAISTRFPRRALQVVAAGNFFDKLKGGGDNKDGGGGGKGNNEDAARRALQDTFGNQKKFKNFFGQEAAGGGDDGKGGFGGFGGGGGGGGGNLSGPDEGGGAGSDRPISVEIIEAFKYAWTVIWNTVLFLAFADLLHRSLDWCCGVELLFLVGAPQQAFERLAGRFFAVVEWIEKNMLGWDIPGEEDMIPQFENIKLFYPRAHAYTFDQYRYKMTDKEKDTLINTYALRHYEREGGHVGDVDPADVAAIRARHDPMEADRQAYQLAKAQGRVEDYWATRKDQYEAITGRKFVRPPGTPPPVPA